MLNRPRYKIENVGFKWELAEGAYGGWKTLKIFNTKAEAEGWLKEMISLQINNPDITYYDETACIIPKESVPHSISK